MTWFHSKMPFPQRVRLLFGSLSPSKFGDEISSFADIDVYPRSWISNPNVSHPGSKFFPSWIPDPRFEFFQSRVLDPGCISKNLNILTKKMVSQLSEMWSRFSSRIRILDLDPDFYLSQIPTLDPRARIQGSKRQRIPDSHWQHWRFRACSGCRG